MPVRRRRRGQSSGRDEAPLPRLQLRRRLGHPEPGPRILARHDRQRLGTDGGSRRLHRRGDGRRPLPDDERRPLPDRPEHREPPVPIQRGFRRRRQRDLGRLPGLEPGLDGGPDRQDPAGPDLDSGPDPGPLRGRLGAVGRGDLSLPPAGDGQLSGGDIGRLAQEVPSRVDLRDPEPVPRHLQQIRVNGHGQFSLSGKRVGLGHRPPHRRPPHRDRRPPSPPDRDGSEALGQPPPPRGGLQRRRGRRGRGRGRPEKPPGQRGHHELRRPIPDQPGRHRCRHGSFREPQPRLFPAEDERGNPPLTRPERRRDGRFSERPLLSSGLRQGRRGGRRRPLHVHGLPDQRRGRRGRGRPQRRDPRRHRRRPGRDPGSQHRPPGDRPGDRDRGDGPLTSTAKILLINPRRGWRPPLGLLYVAGYLRRAGRRVKVVEFLDEAFFPEADAPRWREIEAFDPDVIGLGVISWNRAVALAFIERLRRTWPDKKIVCGGKDPTFQPEVYLRRAGADFVVLHEGEETMLELVEALETGRDVRRIAGLAYREGGEVKATPGRPPVSLEKIPYPALDLVDYDGYCDIRLGGIPGHFLRTGFLMANRGCPYRCRFCTDPVRAVYRERPVDDIVGE
ncbi:MAG: hypothetical protein FJY82_15555, partial [Candidatus Aminicenantes bacterium]|nr:hypothetical protein [Candidatus Aminicenantes bacterium]